MQVIKEKFVLKGKNLHYPGKRFVFHEVSNGHIVPLVFCRGEDDKITAVNPQTNKLVGFVPITVCPANPEREDIYDMLECFVDMGIANPTAIKSKRDNIIVEVSVAV